MRFRCTLSSVPLETAALVQGEPLKLGPQQQQHQGVSESESEDENAGEVEVQSKRQAALVQGQALSLGA